MSDADLKHCQERARGLEAEIAERDSTIARLQKGVNELTAESNRYFKALLEIQNLSGRAVIPEEQALQENIDE